MADYAEFARKRLEAALAGLHDNEEALGEIEQAWMAVATLYGRTAAVTLDPADVVEIAEPRDLTCICPPDLVARGGFRSGCPVHHRRSHNDWED